MNREELRQLESRLGELADYYGAKKPTAAALSVWKDVLEGQQWPDVAAVLTDWPKGNRTFPSGDGVRKLAAARVSDRIEADARASRAAAPTVDVVVGNAMARAEDSPNARAFKRMWQAWRSRKVDSPRQWCLNVLASDQAPDEFKRFAEDSLALMDPEREKRGKYWFEEER